MKLKNGWNIVLRIGKSHEYFAPGWRDFVVGCYVSDNIEGIYFGGIKQGFALRFMFCIPFDSFRLHKKKNT